MKDFSPRRKWDKMTVLGEYRTAPMLVFLDHTGFADEEIRNVQISPSLFKRISQLILVNSSYFNVVSQ